MRNVLVNRWPSRMWRHIWRVCAAALFGLWLIPQISSAHLVQAAVPKAASAKPLANMAVNLPLSFIANAGQVDPRVHFQVSTNSGSLFFMADGLTLSLPAADSSAPNPAVALQLQFEQANPNAIIIGTDLLPGTANFFIGNDPNQWRTNIATFGGVQYQNLYPGIALQYSGQAGQIKGTYTLAPGSDPAAIRWHYGGATQVQIDPASGDVQISGSHGVRLVEGAPIAWQNRAGKQIPVAIRYQINTDHSLRLGVGDYDHSLPLVIDPYLNYSTYLGTSGVNAGEGITVDGSGAAYITGKASVGFPIASAFQPTYGGGTMDAFVLKLNPSGTAVVYSTYIGGSQQDIGYGIATDGAGYAYITGETNSPNFPTGAVNAFQAAPPTANFSAFLTELNPAGNVLVYSSFLNGTQISQGTGIAVSGGGNAYITGLTTSTNFPATVGAYQTTPGTATQLCFIAHFNTNAINGPASLLFSTYLGNSGSSGCNAIALDGANNVYVTGSTTCTSFPTLGGTGAYQTTFNGVSDVFVSEFNTTGSGLIYSTYLGGSGAETATGIGVDGSGHVYVTGYTNSANFPTIAGAYKNTHTGGSYAAFVSELNPFLAAANQLVFSTYLSGTSTVANTQAQGLVVSAGKIYITGSTNDATFPTTIGCALFTIGGGTDAFMSVLDPALTGIPQLAYSTFMGGLGADYGTGLAVLPPNVVFVTGYTSSANFPTTGGAFQTGLGGATTGAFVFSLPIPPPGTPTPTNTMLPTKTGTFTATSTATRTNTATATRTSTATPAFTNTATATATVTQTNTATASATWTSTSTSTSTSVFTNTASATATRTNTATSTSVFTNTPTATASSTGTPTSTSLYTNTPTSTGTPTGSATSTSLFTSTATLTGTSTGSATATGSATVTGTVTGTVTVGGPSATPNPGSTAPPGGGGTGGPGLGIGSEQMLIVDGQQTQFTVTLTNTTGQVMNGVGMAVQIDPLLTIDGFSITQGTGAVNCQKLSFAVGSMQPGQTVHTQITLTAHAKLASNINPNNDSQVQAVRNSPDMARAALSIQQAVNVAAASWDDDNLVTGSQIYSIVPNGKLPNTGEHPVEPDGSTSLPRIAIGGLIALVLLTVGMVIVRRAIVNTRKTR